MAERLDLSRARVLVTGGAGFIGSNFVHRLLARHAGAHVVVLDALTYAGRRENLDGIPSRSLTFVHGDIRDPEAVAKAMAGCELVSTSPPNPTSIARSRPPGSSSRPTSTACSCCARRLAGRR